MRSEINKLKINGEVVIGEGEIDEAPMLFIGEKVGKGKGEDLDIAVDPLEGTNFTAKNLVDLDNSVNKKHKFACRSQKYYSRKNYSMCLEET